MSAPARSSELTTRLPGARRALVVAPHADDEILGAGGLMTRLAAEGWDVQVLFMTMSGYQSAARGDRSTTADVEAEAGEALRVVGVAGHDVLFRGEERHLQLDAVAQKFLIEFIDHGLRRLRPGLVLMPCAGHYHQDHQATNRACVAALRPAPDGQRPLVPTVLAYGHAHGGWGGAPYAFQPSVFADITAQMETKLRALAAYGSQLCEPPHPRSLQGVRDHAASWGAFSGTRYAEPFECIRLLV